MNTGLDTLLNTLLNNNVYAHIIFDTNTKKIILAKPIFIFTCANVIHKNKFKDVVHNNISVYIRTYTYVYTYINICICTLSCISN